jgi:hypothetical protein
VTPKGRVRGETDGCRARSRSENDEERNLSLAQARVGGELR